MKRGLAAHVTVAAVIERDGKFLFVEELIDGKQRPSTAPPGTSPGEVIAAACAREVLEETAHQFEPTGLVGIYRWHYEPKDVTFLRFCFSGKLLGKSDRALDKEIHCQRTGSPAGGAEGQRSRRSPGSNASKTIWLDATTRSISSLKSSHENRRRPCRAGWIPPLPRCCSSAPGTMS